MNRLSFDVTLDSKLLSQDEFVESEKNESYIAYLKELPRKKSGLYIWFFNYFAYLSRGAYHDLNAGISLPSKP